MKPESSLRAILILSILGMLFSGWLSYGELFGGTCPVGGCAKLGPLPTCVYGFIMYLLVFIIAWMGMSKPREKTLNKEEPKKRRR